MAHWVWIGLGGMIGSMARHGVGVWAARAIPSARMAWGTLLVNLIGCLAIGVLAGLAERHGPFSPSVRLFLFTGLLGGFTTFSAFGLESVTMIRRGDLALAMAYVAASVLIGLPAVWLGIQAVHGLSRLR